MHNPRLTTAMNHLRNAAATAEFFNKIGAQLNR